MLRRFLHIKSIFTLLFSLSVAISFASYSNSSAISSKDDKDKGKSKNNAELLSLKNIQRPTAFFSLSSMPIDKGLNGNILSLSRINLRATPIEPPTYNNNRNDIEVNSTILIKTGNNVVVYPYSYKLKPTPFSMFKTPTGR